jgi:hypothetical protein
MSKRPPTKFVLGMSKDGFDNKIGTGKSNGIPYLLLE